MSKALVRYGRVGLEIAELDLSNLYSHGRCSFMLPDGILICGRRYDVTTEDGRAFSIHLDGMIFTRHGTHCSASCEPISVQPPLVMIIEDDEDVRISLREVLENEGLAVQCAPHGRAALELLRSSGKAPSLLLLDLMMPVMDGWQFREAQKADELLRNIPTVAISAGEQRPIDVKLFAKPFDLDKFLETVHAHCARVA